MPILAHKPEPQPPAVPLSLLAVCHDDALHAGNPTEAHLLDDDAPFYALAARANYTTQDGAA